MMGIIGSNVWSMQKGLVGVSAALFQRFDSAA